MAENEDVFNEEYIILCVRSFVDDFIGIDEDGKWGITGKEMIDILNKMIIYIKTKPEDEVLGDDIDRN